MAINLRGETRVAAIYEVLQLISCGLQAKWLDKKARLHLKKIEHFMHNQLGGCKLLGLLL